MLQKNADYDQGFLQTCYIITLFSSTYFQRYKKTKLTLQAFDKMDVFSKVKKKPKNQTKEQNHLETNL